MYRILNIVGGFGVKILALIHPTLLQRALSPKQSLKYAPSERGRFVFLTLTYQLIRSFSIRLCSGLTFKSCYCPRSGLAKDVFVFLVSFFLFRN